MTVRRRKELPVVLALSLAGVMATACGGSGYGTMPSQPAGGGTITTTGAADVTVTIMGMNGANSFAPSPGAVAVGKTVAWRNADTVGHTATGNGFDTGLIPPGATSAPIRFDNAATYSYRCTVHPSMTGSLKVGDSDTRVDY
jgi:plastocyanin